MESYTVETDHLTHMLIIFPIYTDPTRLLLDCFLLFVPVKMSHKGSNSTISPGTRFQISTTQLPFKTLSSHSKSMSSIFDTTETDLDCLQSRVIRHSSITSSISLLHPRGYKPSLSNLSLLLESSNPDSIIVNLLCTFPNAITCLLCCGDQKCRQYSQVQPKQHFLKLQHKSQHLDF